MHEERADRVAAGPRRRLGVAVLLAGLFILHQDVWHWRDPRLVLGLPVGLAYHVGFCLAASVVLALAARWAWPREASSGGAEERE